MVASTKRSIFPAPIARRYQRPISRVLAVGASAWRRMAPPPAVGWCERELHLPPELTGSAGKVDFVTRPYWREPLSLLDDPDVRTISIMGDAQGGKTVLLCAMAISRAACDPAPAMLVYPDQDAMREGRDKIYGMCEVSPAMAARIPPPSKWNDRWIDYGNMLVWLAYSGGRQRMRGRPAKYVFCTEVDVWQDDVRLGSSAKLIQARCKAFVEHKIVYESTPTDDASTIAALYGRSDRRKYLVPCPRCNHWQELRFFPHAKGKFTGKGGVAGMTDKNGAWLTPEQVRGSGYYLGECGCRIESDAKTDMVAAGLWVPHGCAIKRDRVAGTPTRSARNAGFQMSALYAPAFTFGDIAEAYLEHRESNQLRVFWNNWLGLPDRVASRLPHWKTLGQRLAWHHRRGTVPAEAFFLTSQADVQQDHVHFGVRAWGDKRSSWLVEWGTFKRDEAPPKADPQPTAEEIIEAQSLRIASDLARLETEVLAARFPINGTSPLGLQQLPVRLLGVDANYRTFEVHDFVKHAQRRYGDRVRAIRGDHKVDPTELYRASLVERNARTGKVYEGGLYLWGIFVNAFREQLLSLFRGDVDQPGAWLLTSDVVVLGQSYLRQLVNQGPVTEVLPGGKTVVRWKTRDPVVGEHAWDIEVVQLALAEMITGGEWHAAKWARPRPSDLPRAPAGVDLPRDFSDFSAR